MEQSGNPTASSALSTFRNRNEQPTHFASLLACKRVASVYPHAERSGIAHPGHKDARQIFTHAMISLNLPTYEVRITQKDGKKYIYDFLRRRFIALTPEEWVRQNFTHFLVEHKGYPAALLANEVKLNVCGVTRRCDTVLYHREAGRPRLVIEYKAPEVAITQKVFNQISSYNSVFRADYLIVSNGLAHYCCQLDYSDLSVHFLPDIPDYSEL